MSLFRMAERKANGWEGERFLPPHPDPLPQGEGKRVGPASIGHRSVSLCQRGLRCSLSPRERAGVRGNSGGSYGSWFNPLPRIGVHLC